MLNQGTFSDAVDDVMVMSNEQAVAEAEEGNFVRVMDHTPDVILQNVADAEDLEVIVSFHSLYLAARKDGVLPGHYHNLGNITKSLPQILSDPDAIVRMESGRLNVLTRVNTERGDNGLVSVELNTVKDINNKNNKYNLVISMFAANDRYARNNVEKKGAKVEYEKEDLAQVNPQLCKWLATVNAKSSNDPTIPQGTADVNTQYMQDGEKYSRRGESYDQLMGITQEEIDGIQKIPRKSVSQFTPDEIKATEKWARQFYSALNETGNGTKSPYFRAWFGDWRAYDRAPIQIADQRGDARGIVMNEDTGLEIQVSGKVFNETTMHTRYSKNINAVQFLPYINDVVRKAVLLNTESVGGRPKSANTLMMHSFYALADIGNGPELLKLYVEEMNDPNGSRPGRRAYQLQDIEKVPAIVGGVQAKSPSSPATTAGTNRSISDLYALVKQYDKDFTATL